MISPDRLKAVSFFAAFPRSALRVVADRAIERRFATGDILFRAGEMAAGLLVVLEGKVRVVRKAGDRAQVVHVERVGGTLGEVPVFSGGGYPATAFAAEPTVCALIGRDVLLAAVKSNPETAFVLLERLGQRVRELVERLDRTALRPVSARLAEYLIARELHALRASGLLRALGGGRFEIVDATALRARAREGARRAGKAKV
jgi:CRP-like cAMP-binding protein